MKAFKYSVLVVITLLAGACTPNGDPRYVHEGKKEWSPSTAPRDESVETASLNQVDVKKGWALTQAPGADLLNGILKPYSRYVLNAKFVATPANRGVVLSQMVSIFESALLAEMKRGTKTPEFLKIKADFVSTVLDGCSRDLRMGCNAVDFFGMQPHHAEVMTMLASELDADIEKNLAAARTPSRCVGLPDSVKTDQGEKVLAAPFLQAVDCRNLIEQRYRLLALGLYNKRTQTETSAFDFAYLKYASVFALYLDYTKAEQVHAKPGTVGNMSYGYLAETNTSIFQTIISRYSPLDYKSAEFKAFVNTFNPWEYSTKRADSFRGASSQVFEFGTRCCMYDKDGLAPAVVKAIKTSQAGVDQYGLSFRQMILDIEFPDYKPDQPDPDLAKADRTLFKNLGLEDLAARAENPDSGFYNEFFFIVDRLFRGHLTPDQVDRVLRNIDSRRARVELPRMMMDYMKVYLAHMVVRTNRFMATKIYHSNVASNRVFQEAVERSRELTDEWHAIQSSIELLNRLLGSYFKGLNITSKRADDTDLIAYNQANDMMLSVNRNIHYISVFPNMIVMNYFLSKMNGEITTTTYWGSITFVAEKVLKRFFDGEVETPWFHFGVDTEPLDRVSLLYSVNYLLSTQALNAFVTKEDAEQGGGDNRSKFWDLIFTKYLDDSLTTLRAAVAKFEQTTTASPEMAIADPLCDYEAGKGGLPPHVAISFLDLDTYTYGGIGDSGANRALNAFLGGMSAPIEAIRNEIQPRRIYVEAMLQVIADDLLRNHKIKDLKDAHPDLAKGRDLVKQLNLLESQLVGSFVAKHRRYFNCALALSEIEKARTKRLYEEERLHLGEVFDQMQGLERYTDIKAQNAAVKKLNETVFTAENGYRFDQIDGLAYRMSKYDLLMRMKRRIESDVFLTIPNGNRAYANNRWQGNLKSRSVSIYEPDGIERNEMVENRMNKAIYKHGTTAEARADFIRQGMAMLNGSSEAYVKWATGFNNDTSLLSYISSIEQVYLNGPVTSAQGVTYQIRKDEIADAYIRTYATFTLDEMDLHNARDFGLQGRVSKDYLQGKFFDRDGQTRFPFFYSLMQDVNRLGQTDLKGDGEVRAALVMARGFNSLQGFVFEPPTIVRNSVQGLFGEHVNGVLKRMDDLFQYLGEVEKRTISAAKLDPRLMQPFYTEGGLAYSWFDPSVANLTDPQRAADHRILIKEFIQQTGNFYQTKTQVPVP